MLENPFPDVSLTLLLENGPSHIRTHRVLRLMIGKKCLTAGPAWQCLGSQEASHVWQCADTWGQSSCARVNRTSYSSSVAPVSTGEQCSSNAVTPAVHSNRRGKVGLLCGLLFAGESCSERDHAAYHASIFKSSAVQHPVISLQRGQIEGGSFAHNP